MIDKIRDYSYQDKFSFLCFIFSVQDENKGITIFYILINYPVLISHETGSILKLELDFTGSVTPTFLGDVEAIIRRHFLYNVRHKHLAEDIIVEINFLHRPFEGQLGTFVFRLKKSI